MSEPKLTAKQKEAIARRAGGCCEYCRSQARFSPDPFSIEHVVPRSKVEPMKMTIWLWLAKDATTVSTPTLRHVIL